MSEIVRPRRSALYVPGANSRALEKSTGLAADMIILDLEDAVAPAEKEASRTRVCAAIESRAFGPREVLVRVNARGTSWHWDDLRAVAATPAHGVLVPKVDSPHEAARLADALDELDAPQTLRLWVMIETPRAVLAAAEIAASSDRIEGLVIGTNDLVNDLGALHVPGRMPVLSSLSHTILAARASGKAVLDGVYNAVRDTEGFVAEAAQGRALGFDGKTLVHPAQIGPANAAFGPSEVDVQRAHEVIDAFSQAEAAGEGVTVVDGQMIEHLHVVYARRVLALQAQIEALTTAA